MTWAVCEVPSLHSYNSCLYSHISALETATSWNEEDKRKRARIVFSRKHIFASFSTLESSELANIKTFTWQPTLINYDKVPDLSVLYSSLMILFWQRSHYENVAKQGYVHHLNRAKDNTYVPEDSSRMTNAGIRGCIVWNFALFAWHTV